MMSRQSNFQCRSPMPYTLDADTRRALAAVYKLLLARTRARHAAGRNHQEGDSDVTRDIDGRVKQISCSSQKGDNVL